MLSNELGQWMKARREAIDLTRAQVAGQIGCAVVTLEKIERGQRRPSKQMAELLAGALKIPAEARDDFIRFARGQGEPLALIQLAPPHRNPPLTNLPAPLTSFVNRTRELADICAKIRRPDVRLLTLVGPPGIGKTRMSIQAGETMRDSFADGVGFVGLAEIGEPAGVLPAIAHVIGIAESASAPLPDRLRAHLRPREMLLILDNFEQVLDAGADIVTLLQACPKVKCMVTSREPLRLYGEHVYPMPALSLPPHDRHYTAEQLAGFDAIQLFVIRAEANQPGFEVNADNAGLIAEICVRLNGMPLAIELAAARLQQYTLPQLRDALNDAPLQVLTSASRGVEARQRAMRSAIEWSYNLLTPAERAVLNRLGVFAGGCTTQAALHVCELADESMLHALAGRSLIARVAGERWMLLELICEFAWEQLVQASGDALAHVQQRHAQHYAKTFTEERTDANLIQMADAEWHNAEVALHWLVDHQNTQAIPLVLALADYFLLIGSPSQGLRWLHSVWAANIELDALSRAGLCRGITNASWHLHDFTTALNHSHQALEIYRELGMAAEAIHTTMVIGRITIEIGDYIHARRTLLDAVQQSQNIKNEDLEAGATVHLGEAELSLGNIEHAATCFDRAYAISLNHQPDYNLWFTLACIGRGEIALSRRDFPQALASLREGLSGTAMTRARLLNLDVLAGAVGTLPRRAGTDLLRAAKIWGAVDAMREKTGLQSAPANRARVDALMGEARSRMQPKAFTDAWASGRALSLDETMALAMA